MKDLNITPNFSYLTKAIRDRSPHDQEILRQRRHSRPQPKDIKSKWDPFIEEIKELISMPHVSPSRRHGCFCQTNTEMTNFPVTTIRCVIISTASDTGPNRSTRPHPFYGTAPGKQAQFDWKEDMVIHLKDETKICFNVFSLTLGYSREHVFIYSSHKTTQDLLHCLCQVVWSGRRSSEEYLTDNMSAIVSVKRTGKKIDPCTKAFFR